MDQPCPLLPQLKNALVSHNLKDENSDKDQSRHHKRFGHSSVKRQEENRGMDEGRFPKRRLSQERAFAEGRHHQMRQGHQRRRDQTRFSSEGNPKDKDDGHLKNGGDERPSVGMLRRRILESV